MNVSNDENFFIAWLWLIMFFDLRKWTLSCFDKNPYTPMKVDFQKMYEKTMPRVWYNTL